MMVVRRLPQMAVGTEKGSPFQHAGKALLLWGKVHPARTTLRHAKQVPRVPQVPDNRAPEVSLLPQHSDDDRLRPAGCKVRWQPVSASLARETKIKNPGPLLPWACFRSPVFVARISPLTKVVQRGETRATKWHEVQFKPVLLGRHSESRGFGVMGFPSSSQVPPRVL
jgi:hypothetical protein